MQKEVAAIVLGPCARLGGEGDWWKDQHKGCTGSHSLGGGEYVRCNCSCHNTATVATFTVAHVGEVWAVIDKFHSSINTECDSLEVRSDHPNFNGDIREFFRWVLQHGGTFEECYRVQ